MAFLRSQEFAQRNPDVEQKFTGFGCFVFVSIPADIYLITMVLKGFLGG